MEGKMIVKGRGACDTKVGPDDTRRWGVWTRSTPLELHRRLLWKDYLELVCAPFCSAERVDNAHTGQIR